MDSSVPRVINFWRKALNKDLKMTTYEACMLLRVLPKVILFSIKIVLFEYI